MSDATALLPRPTYEQVSTLLDEIVTEYGTDHIYVRPADAADGRSNAAATCLYMHGRDKPGCIIGVLLLKLGLNEEWLYDNDRSGIGVKYWEIFGDEEPTEDQKKALALMVNVQAKQDGGMPWGEAVASAKARVSDE